MNSHKIITLLIIALAIVAIATVNIQQTLSDLISEGWVGGGYGSLTFETVGLGSDANGQMLSEFYIDQFVSGDFYVTPPGGTLNNIGEAHMFDGAAYIHIPSNLSNTQYVLQSITFSDYKGFPYNAYKSSLDYYILNLFSQTDNSTLKITLTYTPQYKVTFDAPADIKADSTATVLTVNGSAKSAADLPYTTDWVNSGDTLNWEYSSSVASTADSANTRYSWTSTSGLNQTTQSGTMTVTAAGTVNTTFTKQYQNSVKIHQPTGGDDSITLTGTYLGNPDQPLLTVPHMDDSYYSVWSDAGQPITMPALSDHSTLTERWIHSTGASVQTSAITSGGSQYEYMYYHQYQVTFDYNIIGYSAYVGSPSDPTAYFTKSGVACATTALTAAGPSDWVDAGTTIQYTDPLSLSGLSYYRWQMSSSPSSGKGTVISSLSGSQTLNPTYYYQIEEEITASGLLESDYLNISGTYLGTFSPTLFVLNSSNGFYAAQWCDYDTTVIVPETSGASTATERWENADGSQIVKQVSISPWNYYPQYRHQYLNTYVASGLSGSVTVDFTVPVYDPTSTTYHTPPYLSNTTTLSSANDWSTYAWIDEGQAATFSALNYLVSPSERFTGNAYSTGAITSAENTYTNTYYHQYKTTFQYSVVNSADDCTAPTAYHTQFGMDLSTTAATGTSIYDWVDAGTAITYTNPLTGSNSTTRWQTNLPLAAGKSTLVNSVNAAETLNPTYYQQYTTQIHLENLAGDVSTNVYGTSFGEVNSVNLTLNSTNSWTANGWLDFNSEFTIPCTLMVSETEQWVLNSGNGIDELVTGPLDLTIDDYTHLWRNRFTATGLQGSDTIQITGKYYNLTSTIATLSASNDWSTYAWSDDSATATYPTVSSASTPSERWILANPYSTDVITSYGATYTQAYTHQYNTTFQYSTSDDTAIPNGITIGSYTQFGNQTPLTTNATYQTISPTSDWVDANTYVTFTDYTNTQNTNRWIILISPTQFNVVAPDTINSDYTHQVGNTYAAKGLESSDAVTVYGTNGATTTLAVLNSSNGWRAFAWSDSGVAAHFQVKSENSGVDERWKIDATSVNTTGGGRTIVKSYQHQCRVSFTALGMDELTQTPEIILTVNSQNVSRDQLPYTSNWLDAGSTISYTFESSVANYNDSRFAWTKTHGLGQSSQNGTLTITTPGTVKATYTQQYAVTVAPTSHGAISPATAYYTKGANQTFDINPEAGYHIVDVTVDSNSVGAVSSWSFGDIQEGHIIAATFASDTTGPDGAGETPKESIQLSFYLLIAGAFGIVSVLLASGWWWLKKKPT